MELFTGLFRILNNNHYIYTLLIIKTCYMKNILVFISLLFVFTFSNAMVDYGNDNQMEVIIDYDVGTPAVIINPFELDHQFFTQVNPESQTPFIDSLNSFEADYQYTDSVFDVGIGKKLRGVINENTLLKQQIKAQNTRYNNLHAKYRLIFYNLNGVLPNDSNTIVNLD